MRHVQRRIVVADEEMMKDESDRGCDGRCCVAFSFPISADQPDFWTLVLVVLTETIHLVYSSCQSIGQLLEGLVV